MAGFDKQRMALARLYAESMHRLAAEQGIEQELLSELDGLLELMDENPELESIFVSPLVGVDSRRRILERALRGRLSDLLVDTLQVMNRKRRLGFLREFVEAYRLEFEEAHGLVEVEVTTPVRLSEELTRRVQAAASKLVGARAALIEKVDESLLGGILIQFGDRKVDTTLARDLSVLGERLIERSSQEVLSGTALVSPDGADSA